MRLRRAAALAGIVLIGSCGTGAGAVAPVHLRQDACAPSSPSESNLIRYLREVVTSDTSADSDLVATRKRFQLPAVEAAAVHLVDDPAVCTRAAAAYTRAVRDTTAAGRNRQVTVVQIGTRYAVDDPFTAARVGEFSLWAIFDAQWHLLVMLAS